VSKLSRRKLITSAAALPALAVPAFARTAGRDPIFPAMERWKEACAAEEAAYDVRAAAQDAFRDRHGSLTPSGMLREIAEFFEKETGAKNAYWCLRTHKQITEIRGDLAQFKPFFHRTLNVQTEDYQKTVAPTEAAANFALGKREEAMIAVFATVPTTLAGMRAKIDFAVNLDPVDGFFNNDEECLRNFLETLYESSRLITQS
jgi:hypothetical protein